MQKVEYKIREVNRKWLSDHLDKLGGTKLFEGETFTYYYDRSKEEFLQSGKRLTVSSKNGKAYLSFRDKYKSGIAGHADEFEVEVSDPNMVDRIMDGLGFHRFITFRKFRVDYQIGSSMVSFDKYLDDLEYIPEFMMIEASSDDEVFELAEKLGYSKSDCQAITVMDLIKYYKDLSKFTEKLK